MSRLDDLDDIDLTPAPTNTRKRPREDDTDSEHAQSPTVSSQTANPNVLQAVKRFAQNKKLRTEQLVEVESFMNDSVLGREGRMYVLQLDLNNKLDKIITTQGTWQLPTGLKKNIQHYVSAACLSTSLSSYRDTVMTTKVVIEKLYALGIDLPPNIRQNPAAEDTLRKAVDNEFTQKRASMKKYLRSSLSKQVGTVWITKESKDCTNIFELTKTMVKGSQCTVNAALCARVAIMRRAYTECDPGKDYWIEVDELLENMREKGEYDKEKISVLVEKQLLKDRRTYGVDNYTIINADESPVQSEINGLIEARRLAGETEANDQREDGEKDSEKDGRKEGEKEGEKGSEKDGEKNGEGQRNDN